MKETIKLRSFSRFALVVCVSVSGYAIGAAPGYMAGQATALEVLQLPKFCWWEFDARYAATQNLIQNCPGANHYCFAELSFIRSNNPSRSKSQRLHDIQHALKETEYTLRAMKDSPACSIRGHVSRKYSEIRASFPRHGQPMPPSMLATPAR